MHILYEKYCPADISKVPSVDRYAGCAVLDFCANGHYWRNSVITKFCLIRIVDGEWREEIRIPEKEEDEYSLLAALPEDLKGVRTIITYNGTSFDLPFIRNKCRAYELPDPFSSHIHRDLLRDVKPLTTLLQLPSRKIDDFRDYFDMSGADDACVTLSLLLLDAYLDFFEGGYTLQSSYVDESHLYFTLLLQHPVYKKASLHDGVFHLILDKDEAHLGAKITDGKLRLYYPDYENYVYLPYEGYAVHKSLAASVDKSRRQKAVRENCFTLLSADTAFLSNENHLKAYLASAVRYLKNSI